MASRTASGNFAGWAVERMTSGPGTRPCADSLSAAASPTAAKEAEPGVYWLRAYNADGASSLRPFIVGTLVDVAEKEPNDDLRKTQSVDHGAVVNGKLEKPGDVDCYAVSLKKGQTLVASLEAHHTLRSPMDAILQIVSTDGFVLDEIVQNRRDTKAAKRLLIRLLKKAGMPPKRIIANLVLSPGKSGCQAKFPRAAAIGANSLSVSLTRELADGTQQFSSIAVNATATTPLSPPLGVFAGCQVGWTIKDVGTNRTLAIAIQTPDPGADEVWHLELCVKAPAGGKVNVEVKSTPPQSTVSSVDVTP